MSRRIFVGTIGLALLFTLIMSAPRMIVAQPGNTGQTGHIVERPPEPASRDAQGVNHIGNGPNNLPTPTDALFMVDSGLTMDQYLFRNQGPIEFGIEVDRVVGRTNSDGYLLDPQGLIDKGIISSKVQLQLSVFDVDEDYPGSEVNPEFDKVYVNGNYVGKLTGANDTWSVTRLEIDVRHVKFAVPSCNEFNGSTGPDYLSVCDTAPTPKLNDIRIDIDTTNTDLIWAVEVDWAAMSFEAARPILLVHGKGGSNDGEDACSVPNAGFGCEYFDKVDSQYYFGFRKQLNQAGFLTGIVENYLGGEVSIADNAERLSRIIDRFKKRYGVDKINLVGHSKGGLDSRGYISNHRLNDDNDVAALITLASPHHGSYLADMGSKLPEFALDYIGYADTPALENVSEKYMDDTFNPSHPAREGVRYYSVAAEAGEDCFWGSCVVEWQTQAVPEASQQSVAGKVYQFLYRIGKYKGINDFMVTVRSTEWQGIGGHTSANSFEYGPFDLNHHSIRAAMQEAGEFDATITNLVRDILDVKPNTIARAYRQDDPRLSDAEDAERDSSLGVESGTIGEGQTITLPVGVDTSSEVSFLILWEEGDIYLNLRDPQGNLITPTVVDVDINYSEDRIGGSLGAYFVKAKSAGYSVVNPEIGLWQAEIIASSDLPNDEQNWVLLVSQDSEITTSVTPHVSWQSLNGLVHITAEVKAGSGPITNASVVGRVMRPDNSVQVMTLYDDGAHEDGSANDGVYGNSFTGDQVGIYGLSAKAQGVWNGTPFVRSAVSEVQIGSGTAMVVGNFTDQGQDTNGDGLYDYLRVGVPLQVSSQGQYMVFAELRSSGGGVMAKSNVVADLAPGNHTVFLEFSGTEIWSNGGNGQFTLSNVTTLDMTAYELPIQVDLQSAPYVTSIYARDDFQHQAVALTGSSNDYGRDTNNNGLFDELIVEVDVDLQVGGHYYWNARLVDAEGHEFGWYGSEGTLASGVQSVSFIFDGQAIGDNRRNGPYYLVDLALWGNGGFVNSIEVAQTQAYNYSQFESTVRPGGVFLPILLNGQTTPVQSLLNGDFEQGPSVGWQEYSSNGWAIVTHVSGLPNTLPPPGGQWAAWLGGDHYEISYIEQEVTVPTDRPYLTYSHFLASEDYCGYDFAGVLVNGAVVDVYDLCSDTNSTGWSQHAVNLNAYRGQTVALQIRVETDGSLFSSLYVDNVGFSASAAAAQAQAGAPQSPGAGLSKRDWGTPAGTPGPAEPRRLR